MTKSVDEILEKIEGTQCCSNNEWDKDKCKAALLAIILEAVPKEFDGEESSVDHGREEIMKMRGYNNAIYKVRDNLRRVFE